jgi:hypothetical protein
MHSTTLKRALVVASVALTLPVLGAGTALAAPSDGAHGKDSNRSSTHGNQAPASHGKDNETDPSGSSANPDGTFQGKSTSTPDQDGKGADHGADNNDKTGPGTDGNNGCGNEPRPPAPRDGGRPTDDDNNGWCGSKPKPAHRSPSAAPQVTDTAAPRTAARPPAPVTRRGVTTSPAAASGVVVAQAQSAPRVVRTAEHLNAATSVVSSTAAGGAGTVAVAGAHALPFTGAPVGLLLLLSLATVAAGLAITLAGRRRSS